MEKIVAAHEDLDNMEDLEPGNLVTIKDKDGYYVLCGIHEEAAFICSTSGDDYIKPILRVSKASIQSVPPEVIESLRKKK